MEAEIKGFGSFLRKNAALSVYTVILTVVVYGIKIFNTSYGMDTNYYIEDPSGYFRHWIGIGRFGEVILKKIFWGHYTNISLINMLTFVFFALSSLLLCYLFSKFMQKTNTIHLFIIPSLLITSQFFVYQFYFVLQNFEFVFSMFLVILSIIFVQHEYSKKYFNYLSFIFSILLLTLAISVYQSFILFYTGLCAGVLLMHIYSNCRQKDKLDFMKLLKMVLPYLLVFFISIALYFILDKLVCFITEIPRQGHSTDMMVWPRVSLQEGIDSLLNALSGIIFSPVSTQQYVYNFGMLIGIILMIFASVKIMKAKASSLSVLLSCIFVLMISAFGIVVAVGGVPLPRSMAPQFPFVVSFLFFYGSLFIKRKEMKYFIFIIGSVLTFSQIRTTSNLLLSEQMTFEEDQRMMVQIDQAVKDLNLENSSSYHLMIMGTSQSENKFNLQAFSELIGVSLFQFGYSDEAGSYFINDNVLVMMNIMGMSYLRPTYEEYQQYRSIYESRQEHNGIFEVFVIDDFILIKIE